jgi:hypothetical protein
LLCKYLLWYFFNCAELVQDTLNFVNIAAFDGDVVVVNV